MNRSVRGRALIAKTNPVALLGLDRNETVRRRVRRAHRGLGTEVNLDWRLGQDTELAPVVLEDLELRRRCVKVVNVVVNRLDNARLLVGRNCAGRRTVVSGGLVGVIG